MKKVRIGVCTPDKGGAIPWLFFKLNVFLAGGIPFRITPDKPATIDDMDGLIISGGADIAPKLYGAQSHSEEIVKEAKQAVEGQFWFRKLIRFAVLGCIYALRRMFGLKHASEEAVKRDDLEFALIIAALKKQVPLLGVCRGMQLLNVVQGGTLYLDLADAYEDVSNPYTVFPYKEISVQENSKLGAILGQSKIRVNSMHHQAVDRLGSGLKVVAEDGHGIVEAIEIENGCFALGVQWHPEFLVQFKSQRNIFKGLVDACRLK